MKVSVLNGKFAVQCPFMENHLAMGIPDRVFRKAFKMYACKPTYDNARHFLSNLREYMDDAAVELAQSLLALAEGKTVDGEPPAVAMEGLMPHQQTAIKKAWSKETFAILHRPRCRKTATTIRLACARYLAGQLDRFVVIVPTSIKKVWEREWPKRAVVPHDIHVLDAEEHKYVEKAHKWLKTPFDGIKVLIIGTEAMSSGTAVDIADLFGSDRGMMVVDESTRIANYKSLRTKAVWEAGEKYRFRVILTGSEVTRNPENLFAQFRFLGVHVLKFDSFYAWRNRYCMMGGFQKKKIVGMKNVDEFMDNIGEYSHLVKTTDVVDMPEKVPSVRMIKPTDDQKRVIRDLQKTMMAEFEGGELSVQTAMTMVLRAQQVCGGFFPSVELNSDGDPVTTPMPMKTNPKLAELMSVLDDEPGKVLVWARFRSEIAAIVEAMRNKYGPDSVVEFHGGKTEHDRDEAERSFQTDDAVRYMVANPQAGSMGREFSAADVMVWYSQDFNYENRIQALERCTNLDKLKGIGVVDLCIDLKADRMIQEANEQKQGIASWVENAIHGRTFALDE